jgi:hypothetical protein
MSDEAVPVARRLELAGVLLIVASVLLLVGGLSSRWVEGTRHVGYNYDAEEERFETLALGPAGIRRCNEAGCAPHGWKSLREAHTSRALAIAVLVGEVLAGLWALVAGLLAAGGSVRVLRPVWMRWPLAVVWGAALLFAVFLFTDAGDAYLSGDLACGLIGPFVAWFAIARLAHPVFRALELSGDPTGATLR